MSHPCLIADEMGAVNRPLLAYDLNNMFLQEVECVLKTGLVANRTSHQDLLTDCVDCILAERHRNDLVLICLYHQILSGAAQDTNGDGVWNQTDRYQAILSSPNMSVLIHWILKSFSIGIFRFLSIIDANQTLVDRKGSFFFLTQPVYAYAKLGSIEPDDSEETLEEIRDQLGELNNTVYQLVEMSEQLSPKEETKEEPEVKTIEIKGDTIESIIDSFMTGKNNGNRLPPQKLNWFWFAPPPLSPSFLYRFDGLSASEIVFLTETFIDIYNTEMALLELQFFLTRLSRLWTRSGTRIEPALYSHEVTAIQEGFDEASRHLGGGYTAVFLAFEGFTMMSDHLLGMLGKFMPSKPTEGFVTPIIDARVVLDEVLETVRNGCVVVDRLRTSILYGRRHKSYVGDDFLKSYYYGSYITRHSTSALSSVSSALNVTSYLNLPEDQQKQGKLYQSIYDRARATAIERNIMEPDLRTIVDLPAPSSPAGKIRKTVPVQGELNPLTRPSRDAQMFIDMLETIWKNPGFYTYVVNEEEEQPVEQETS